LKMIPFLQKYHFVSDQILKLKCYLSGTSIVSAHQMIPPRKIFWYHLYHLHTTRVCPVPSHASCPHARGLRSKLNRRKRLKNHGNRPNQIRWVEKITS